MKENQASISPEDYEINKDLELTRFGELVLTSVTYGPTVDNEQLVKKVGEHQDSPGEMTESEARDFIDRTGITLRRHSFSVETPVDEVVETSAKIGAAQLQAIMADKNWGSIDLFIDTSASLPLEVGSRTLEFANLNPQIIAHRSYRTACSGTISALVDSLADPELRDKRIVICALEPLSRHISNDHYKTIEGLSIPAIFGDDYAAIAFRPRDFEQIAAKTVVTFDDGTLRFYTDYQLPTNDPDFLPEHYSFGSGGKEIFAASETGVFIEIQSPRSNLSSEMDGRRTAKFFIRQTINVIEELLSDAHLKFEEHTQVFGHQPSIEVNTGFQNRLRKQAPGITIPDFLLGEIQRSNSSSATAPIIWQHLVKVGALNHDKPFLVYAPGIGSVISASVIKQK